MSIARVACLSSTAEIIVEAPPHQQCRKIQRSLLSGSQAVSGKVPFGALRSPIGADEAVAAQMAGIVGGKVDSGTGDDPGPQQPGAHLLGEARWHHPGLGGPAGQEHVELYPGSFEVLGPDYAL
jgi:hypothetical protein